MDALEVSRAASARELQEHTRDSAQRATAFRFERASLRPRLLLLAMAASSSPDWRPSRPPYPARPPAVVSQIAEKFSESTAAGLARDVVRALAHCHAHGVIHRDIKVGRSRSSRASRSLRSSAPAAHVARSRAPQPPRCGGNGNRCARIEPPSPTHSPLERDRLLAALAARRAVSTEAGGRRLDSAERRKTGDPRAGERKTGGPRAGERTGRGAAVTGHPARRQRHRPPRRRPPRAHPSPYDTPPSTPLAPFPLLRV